MSFQQLNPSLERTRISRSGSDGFVTQWRLVRAAHTGRWARFMCSTAIAMLVLGFPGSLKLRGDEFWNGAVSYTPPFRMLTNSQPEMRPDSLHRWGFCSWDGNAKVIFSVESLSTLNDMEGPTHAIRTLLDLKEFLDAKHKADPRGPNAYSTQIIKLADGEALGCSVIPDKRSYDSDKWFYSVCFFWEQNPVWQKTTICEVIVTANKEQTLAVLTNSLNSIRISPAELKK